MTQWEDALKKLVTTHTLDIRGICQLLKGSRTWVNRYILPNLPDSVFLNSGIRGTERTMNWKVFAQTATNRKLISDKYFSRPLFLELMKKSLKEADFQTRNVPIELFFTEEALFTWCELRESLKGAEKNDYLAYDILKKMYEVQNDEKFFKKNLFEVRKISRSLLTARGSVPRISLDTELLKENIEETLHKMIAPKDMKGYGDTDELVYRKLFTEPWLRLRFRFSNSNGDITERVYYIFDSEYDEKLKKLVEKNNWSGIYIAVPYEFYVSYFKKSL